MKEKKPGIKAFVIWIALIILFFVLSIVSGGGNTGHGESLSTTMKDAVLHHVNTVSLFGIMNVNPAVISAFTVTAALLIAALLIRIFALPRFSLVPGRFQMAVELIVGYFSDLADQHCQPKSNYLRGYIFAAGAYIFTSTFFELFGFHVMAANGNSIALPAPLSDINAALAMGVLSYLFIMSGGIKENGAKGILLTLKEFSLPVSLSFRLFGALLSGLLVTELVYYTIYLSYVLPVLVGVMFTLLHALIQTYVLTMLVSTYYGEVTEKKEGEKLPG